MFLKKLIEIENKISSNRIDEAIANMIYNTQVLSLSSLYELLLAQRGRLSSLEKNKLLGIISTSDISIEENKILHAVIKYLFEMKEFMKQ